MISMTLIFCLGLGDAHCIEQRPPVDPTSLMGCLTGGQQAAAHYLQEHPGWRLARWRCRSGPREEQA